MNKLIYVDRLKKDILALQDCHNGFSDTYDKACIIGVIDEQPTIEKRKAGRWTVKEGELAFWDVCSVCRGKIIHRTPHYNFCPNCGADMRGEQHETD